MNLSYHIAKRLSTGKNSGTALLVVRIAVIGVACSVAIMIISMAIIKGYQLEIRNKITGFSTHIQISRLDLNNSFETNPIPSDSLMEKQIANQPGITHLQRFAIKPGIIKTTDEFEGVVLKGVDNGYNWSFLNQYMKEGTTLQFDGLVSDEIVVSESLAKRLHLKLHDKITMYFVQDPPRARRFKIKGIYNTGFEDLDKLYVFADIRQVQKLNNWFNGAISGYEITVEDDKKTDEYSAALLPLIPYNLEIRTSSQMHPELFDWLNLLDLNVWVIILLMVVVACINMITALLILIVERTNMIGILKALGLKNRNIRSLFLYMASYLIVLGLIFGNLIGLGLCYSQKLFGWLSLSPEAYFIDKVPIQLIGSDILMINAGSFLVCYLILLIPARYVSRISPSKAIRFE